MGRKPKAQVNTEPTPLPQTVEEENVSETTETIEIDTTSLNVGTISSGPAVTILINNNSQQVLDLIAQEMAWAKGEIERCDDYIYSSADLDRRFSVYRTELYVFRYNIRQLSLRGNYPNIDISLIPKRPDYVADV